MAKTRLTVDTNDLASRITRAFPWFPQNLYRGFAPRYPRAVS